jgi:hypothetical protein
MDEIEKIDQEHEEKHVRNIVFLAVVLDQVYHKHITTIWHRLWPLLPADIPGKPFNIESRPVVLKLLNGMTDDMIRELEQTISRHIRSEWKLSNQKNDAMIRAMFERSGRDIPEGLQAKLFPNNDRALESFLTRSKDGLTLSKRVWNLKPQILTEVEAGLQLSIAEGKSAAQQATAMKLYLKDPDRLFRRVRDIYGRLQLSKAAKEYHPGQGKYRSSYKNALRLTRNTVNQAYRTSDHERWKDQKFILGIEVKLSNRHFISDICNEAVGIYPAGFKFTGFHCNCLCNAVPIRANEKQFNSYIDSILNDQDQDFEFSGQVQDIPTGLKNWYAENKERISNWKHTPNFIKENSTYLNTKS